MSPKTATADAQAAKANMDAIYVQPDPRAYFRELGKVDYAIPGLARPIFRKVLAALRGHRAGNIQALDIGCSYGVNAALLKHDLTMDALTQHWQDPAIESASPAEVADADRAFFAGLDSDEALSVIGLDQSEPAIAFGEETGLLDAGLTCDLECEPLPAAAAELLAPTDLVLSTGAIGYITQRSFDHLLPAITRERAPWMAHFVLRMFPFDAIAQTLADHGYVTEKLEGRTFQQRRFVTDAEQAGVLAALDDLGIDPEGREAEGALHAEFFLSRPTAEAGTPLGELLAA